jgi:hypothetical protein
VQGVAAGGVSIVGKVGSDYADSIWSRACANASQNAVVRNEEREEVNPLYDYFWLGPPIIPDAASPSPSSDDDTEFIEDFDTSASAFTNDDENDENNDGNNDEHSGGSSGRCRGKKHRLTRRLSRKYNHTKKKSKMTKRKLTKYSKKKKYKQNKL